MNKGFAKAALIFSLTAVLPVALAGCQNTQTTDLSSIDSVKAAENNSAVSAPLDKLADSVNYSAEFGVLSFTVPENVSEGQKLYIHVSGRLLDGTGGGISWHAFETETENDAWIPGHVYEAQIDSESLESVTVASQILSSEGDTLAEKTIEIDARGNIVSN